MFIICTDFSGFTEKMNSADMLNAQNCINPMGNCVHQEFELFGFAKKLNIHNCVNLMGNYVHQLY